MKKIVIILLSLLIFAAALASCGEKEKEPAEQRPAKLVYSPYGEDISVELTSEETARVREIFGGAKFLPENVEFACGFGPDVSIDVDGIVYMIGCDGCGSVKVGTRCFDISDAETDEIHGIFEKYGGHFPCV